MKAPNHLDSALAEQLQHLDQQTGYPPDDTREVHREVIYIVTVPYWGRRRAERGIESGLARIIEAQFGPRPVIRRLDGSEVPAGG